MNSSKYVILGGGMAAGYAAKEIVSRGLPHGELTIISAEDALPYERPPLSKGFLAGKETEDSILINKPEWYREHGIALQLKTPVAALDARNKRLQLSSGDTFGFQKLLIATCARSRNQVLRLSLGSVMHVAFEIHVGSYFFEDHAADQPRFGVPFHMIAAFEGFSHGTASS